MGLRIALDARHIRDFGIGTYIRNLIRGLAQIDDGNRYVLICQQEEREQFHDLPPNFRTVAWWHTDAERIDHVAFPAFLKRMHADLFHIPLNRVPWFMPRPYVVTVHDMSRQLFAGAGWRNQLSMYRARRGLMRAGKVIAVSGSTMRAAESVLGIPHEHIRRIHNAPDPRFGSPPPQGAGWPQDRQRILDRYQVNYPFILYAGNIKPQKNIPRLIEAFSVLRTELSEHEQYRDLRLIIIGDEITRHPEVRRAASQGRCLQVIRFLGYVPFDTLRAFYESAAAFAFPSLHEGFGLPPLEAMACGTPVMTSNVSSLPEVVGDAALTVSPDNLFEIAHGLREVLLNETLRAELIEKGYRQVRRFSWERTAREVLETYREVLRTP